MSHIDVIKYTKEDFRLGIKSLTDNVVMKTKFVDKSTQTPHEVYLHIPGVGVITGSPFLCVSVCFFFYRYIITHAFKQHKNTITRYKYIGSTWGKHKKKFLIKKLTKNN